MHSLEHLKYLQPASPVPSCSGCSSIVESIGIHMRCMGLLTSMGTLAKRLAAQDALKPSALPSRHGGDLAMSAPIFQRSQYHQGKIWNIYEHIYEHKYIRLRHVWINMNSIIVNYILHSMIKHILWCQIGCQHVTCISDCRQLIDSCICNTAM